MSADKIHLDQAVEAAADILRDLAVGGQITKAVLINDLFGRLRVGLWISFENDPLVSTLRERLGRACGSFWSNTLWVVHGEGQPSTEASVAEAAWAEGTVIPGFTSLRINDRHRSRTSWFLPPSPPPKAQPPIIAFYSFKGGVGRTTAVAALSIAWARRGKRVAVLDFDLDAPGVGRLLDADGLGTTATWGAVDYLLESGDKLPLSDYRHTCARAGVTGDGVIDVYPAGTLDGKYLSKLGKLDLELRDLASNPIAGLITRIREETQPDLVIIDSRAGLAPVAGLVLSGLAHVHVIVSTSGDQALSGLRLVVQRLGEARLRNNHDQAECVIIQGMVPEHPEIGANAISHFQTEAEDIFINNYYVANPDPDDRTWSLQDLDLSEAPHRAVPVRYKTALADFRSIDSIADVLIEDNDYIAFTDRVDARLRSFIAQTTDVPED